MIDTLNLQVKLSLKIDMICDVGFLRLTSKRSLKVGGGIEVETIEAETDIVH